eukprot:15257681-Ditylum_brightwellii.AAC.1
MSAKIYRMFPEGLRHAEAECGKPQQTPPIRFVPPSRPSKDSMDDSPLKTITVELAQEMIQKVVLYEFSGIEIFLMMQKFHEYFLSQQEARKKDDLHDQADDAILAQLDTILKDTCDKKELVGMKKPQDMHMALDKKMDALIARAFNLYQQMLSPTLRAEWDGIVQKHCYTASWLDKNKIASKENRGQDWDTLRECKCLHLLTMCKNDAAERHAMYMSVMVRKPPRMSLEL